uniref:Transcriptional coactivator p15 (PC4) C-terminal domain-containing protein n=1 Tax=uncultured Elusimicrobia bacterium TaxID=699876 RepID=A0A650EMF4_9BACT|nr:hypothetical protein Elusimicrob1349_0820 [uncultured Elusimicrobia bacterium]
MSESSFTLLREIGALLLDNGEEVRFSIDAYRGYRYVSVRRYIQTDGFSGATRDGITLTPEILRVLAPLVAALPDEAKLAKDGALGKFAKRPGICVVASVSRFRGKTGLELRQWQEDTGWTKKGIWLPYERIKEIKALFVQTKDALDEAPPDLDDF